MYSNSGVGSWPTWRISSRFTTEIVQDSPSEQGFHGDLDIEAGVAEEKHERANVKASQPSTEFWVGCIVVFCVFFVLGLYAFVLFPDRKPAADTLRLPRVAEFGRYRDSWYGMYESVPKTVNFVSRRVRRFLRSRSNSPSLRNNEDLQEELIRISVEAGNTIMGYYRKLDQGRAESTPEAKTCTWEGQCTTDADIATSEFICGSLKKLFPTIPTISEEATVWKGSVWKETVKQMKETYKERSDPAKTPYIWMIDPIDGTSAFSKKKGHFTVNIALLDVSNGSTPIMGFVYSPLEDALWYADIGHYAFKVTNISDPSKRIRKRIRVNQRLTKEQDAVNVGVTCCPIFAEAAYIQHFYPKFNRTEGFGGKNYRSSRTWLMVAEGELDVALRIRGISEWDIAAVYPIIYAAGGDMVPLEVPTCSWKYYNTLERDGKVTAKPGDKMQTLCVPENLYMENMSLTIEYHKDFTPSRQIFMKGTYQFNTEVLQCTSAFKVVSRKAMKRSKFMGIRQWWTEIEKAHPNWSQKSQPPTSLAEMEKWTAESSGAALFKQDTQNNKLLRNTVQPLRFLSRTVKRDENHPECTDVEGGILYP